MYTQCPQCKSVFRLRVEQLRSGQGETRCYRCKISFNALASINPTAENISFFSFDAYKIPVLQANQAVENLNKGVIRSDRRVRRRHVQKVPDEPVASHASRSKPVYQADLLEQAESNVSAPWDSGIRRLPDNPVFWQRGAILLVLFLLSQVLWVNSRVLTQNASFRSFLAYVNPWLSPYRDVRHLRVLDSKLEPSGHHAEQMDLRILLKNTAHVPQSLSSIRLMLLDERNRPFAARLIKPSEYKVISPKTTDRGIIEPAVVTELLVSITVPRQTDFGYRFNFF